MSVFLDPPKDFTVIESSDEVPGIRRELRTRFRIRAEARARKLNAQRLMLSYHWKVIRRDGRWEVRAFQNYLLSSK